MRFRTQSGDRSAVVIASGDSTETVFMRWGLEPLEPGGKARILIRSDGREFPVENRCLIPATELPLTDRNERKWTAALDEGGSFFCFAGVWRPATATWPPAYAALTVAAYPDLATIKDRHIAFMPKDLWGEWLGGAPAAELLQPLPVGSLRVQPVQAGLFEER